MVVEGESVKASEAFRAPGDIERFGYGCPFTDIELLLFPYPALLPAGMFVDECVLAVWRVRAVTATPPVTFRAEWAPDARNQDGGYACGEHLTALTWGDKRAQVSIGTSDEEMLRFAAQSGFVPERLSEVFERDDVYWPVAVREHDGLEIPLPALLAGERVQVHVVIAWNTGEDDSSTWFAVDVAPKEVSRRVEEVLGRRRSMVLADTERLTIEMALAELVGLPLSDMWRFFSAQRFEFGEQRPAKNRKGEEIMRADFTLVAYAWQIEGPDGFKLTSIQLHPVRSDEHAKPFYGSLGTDPPIVESIAALGNGRLVVSMSHGYQLTVLTDSLTGSRDPSTKQNFGDLEVWRFIPPDQDVRGHLVMGVDGPGWFGPDGRW